MRSASEPLATWLVQRSLSSGVIWCTSSWQGVGLKRGIGNEEMGNGNEEMEMWKLV